MKGLELFDSVGEDLRPQIRELRDDRASEANTTGGERRTKRKNLGLLRRKNDKHSYDYW